MSISKGVETLQTPSSFVISGRTDLRIGVSEAKFDVEDDFDVKNSLAPPKSTENHEKPKKKLQKQIEKKYFFRQFFFRFGIVWNAFWQRSAGQILEKNGEMTQFFCGNFLDASSW